MTIVEEATGDSEASVGGKGGRGEGARAMKRDDAPSHRSRCPTPSLALGNNNQLMMATKEDTTDDGEASKGWGGGGGERCLWGRG